MYHAEQVKIGGFLLKMTKLTTIELSNQINDLIKYGFTYTEVGKMYGKSKSAISGLVFRAKQMGYVDGIKKLEPNKPKATKIKNKISLAMPPNTKGITIFKLKNTSCRYMIGNHKYCGHKDYKRSYCEYHYKICYQRKKK